MPNPWDKNPVTPEAEQLVARNRAERNLERSFPKKWWHDMAFGWAGTGVIALVVGSVAVLAYLLLFK
ncbi:hypothetical protein [Stenotrophomonas rhizophila]|uniref:hypothetical protein n=1 Tax=Stenotrophomonas rhizophila TaxID=216778 RepID=UPI00371C854F